jgi:hypothetical protein
LFSKNKFFWHQGSRSNTVLTSDVNITAFICPRVSGVFHYELRRSVSESYWKSQVSSPTNHNYSPLKSSSPAILLKRPNIFFSTWTLSHYLKDTVRKR